MSDFWVGLLLLSIYGSIIVMMFMISYKKFKKRKHKAHMKNRLKLIKGDEIDKQIRG